MREAGEVSQELSCCFCYCFGLQHSCADGSFSGLSICKVGYAMHLSAPYSIWMVPNFENPLVLPRLSQEDCSRGHWRFAATGVLERWD